MRAERCESRQVFKKVLKNGAVGVFQGKILVKPGAQKTDGYQISQALLLDEDSQFLAKPELEIYADDVKCSHGSTSGAIDETALFYLRSRGVPHAAGAVAAGAGLPGRGDRRDRGRGDCRRHPRAAGRLAGAARGAEWRSRTDIVASWRAPARGAAPPSGAAGEVRALCRSLLVACLPDAFVAQWPGAGARERISTPTMPLDAAAWCGGAAGGCWSSCRCWPMAWPRSAIWWRARWAGRGSWLRRADGAVLGAAGRVAR